MGSRGGGEGNPQYPLDEGEGPPTPGRGAPGGPGGPGGAAPPMQPTPQAPIRPTANVRVMGTPPQIFSSNKVEAKDFLDKFQ